MFAQERGEGGEINGSSEEVTDVFAKSAVLVRVDAGFRVHHVDVAGGVGDDGDLFVAEGALGFGREFGAVVPHGFGHDAAVVGDDSIVHEDVVLEWSFS